jgi:hypothetical protein
MTPIYFNRYSPNAEEKIIVAERITHWERLGGAYGGSRIYLDTGKEILVGEAPHEVEAKIKLALERK